MTVRLVHQNGGEDTWTVTFTPIDGLPVTYQITPDQSLDVEFTCESLSIQRHAIDETPDLESVTKCTIYLTDEVQIYPSEELLDHGSFGVWCLFFAWVTVRLLS